MKMKTTRWAAALLALCCCACAASAQSVRHERLLSFEEPQVPAFITATASGLAVSDEHYREGRQSLCWTFGPNALLSVRKELKFEPKDPTGKDTYLSAFIVWVYNEEAQEQTIQFEFLKAGRKCASFPFGINFTGWRGAWVCYERDMQGTPE